MAKCLQSLFERFAKRSVGFRSLLLSLRALLTLSFIFVLASSEPPVSKHPLVFNNWPQKNSKQIVHGRNPGGKKRTFVVQIRSDQPVPLVLKGRPGNGHPYAAHLHHAPPEHLRGARPLKLTAPVYLKPGSGLPKAIQRKPLKIKLINSKSKSKPAISYEKPYKYEKPSSAASYSSFGAETQKLPLMETHGNFISDHFAPIHTIPAPNLGLHDNHLHQEQNYLLPKPQPYHQSQHSANGNQYQVFEENTNDHTVLDPLSGSQKLFAPDPDPSLPTSKIHPASEHFNLPSNGKPLPVDVQTNYLLPAQPLIQFAGSQESIPEIYPIQFTQQAQLQPIITANVAAVQSAPIPIYNPTYLVTQSNNLYTQHKQHLFNPIASIVDTGYVNADLTQEVASNGQILQAAKDPHNNIHPVLDSAPQFAALIAAPVLGEEHALETTHFRLPNVAAESTGPEGGFVVSNYYGNAQESSQLLQAYAEEEAQRQQLEVEQSSIGLQKLQQEQEQQLFLQQQQNHLLDLQQDHYEQAQLHMQQEGQQQQHQFHLQQQKQQLHSQQQQSRHQQQIINLDPAAAAFEEHQRLVKQQLGNDTPLRIFVPDDDTDGQRLQKRSDNIKKGTVEDASTGSDNNGEDLFEVSSSVEVSSENQSDGAVAESSK